MRRVHTKRLFAGWFVAGALAAGAAGCAKSDSATPVAAAAAADPGAVRLAPDNVVTAAEATLVSGPAISGQLTPARAATVRAQVGGSITMLTVDRGQPVTANAVVAKISSRDLEASFASTEAAVKSADTSLALAQRELARTEALVQGGALAARDLEQARNAVATGEAMAASAQARQRAVWQQLDDTSVKAPFDGIVSERQANMGDVVAAGTPLLTIIDPTSLRLEALVPADQMSAVKPGARVRFTVRGLPNEELTGSVERLGPTADPVTRQVSIFVSVPNRGGKLIAGLYAEGHVEAASRTGVVAPMSAVDETGPVPLVTRVAGGKAERVPVTLGLRQTERETVEIVKGVSPGDVLIIGSAKGVATGTGVIVVK